MATGTASRRAAPALGLPPAPTYFGQDSYYKIGTADPRLRADPGAGPWRSKPIEARVVAQRQLVDSILGLPTLVYPGFNATKHMRHYLGNSGRNLTIDLEDMIKTVPSARRAMVAEFRQAQRFIQTLPPGEHRFTSRVGESSYNYKSESPDWFFATGGYTYWGKGVAKVLPKQYGNRYEVEFRYCFYDRYNWDGGKSVEIGGITITDEFMAEFHRQGLAREFDCIGEVTRRFTWEGLAAQPSEQAILTKPGR